MPKTLRDGSMVSTGDVVLIDLDPTRGSETRKTRPCLLIEAGSSPLPLVLAVPITDNAGGRRPKLFVPIPDLKTAGLSKMSAVDCYQMRSVSIERILGRLGQVDDQVMDAVKVRIALILDIGEEHL
jgi:mRNA interferase MazF